MLEVLDERFFRRLALRGKLGAGRGLHGRRVADERPASALVRAVRAQRRAGLRPRPRWRASRGSRARLPRLPRLPHAAPRRARHPRALRPRQRVLRALARRLADLLVRALRAPGPDASPTRSRPSTARLCDHLRLGPRRPPARDRLRLGRHGDARRARARLPRHHDHDLARAARARDRAACARPAWPTASRCVYRDYRRVEGSYDKIVSIEMIEAIGHRQFADLLRDARPRCSRPTARRAAVDPDPRPALRSATAAARLDAARTSSPAGCCRR